MAKITQEARIFYLKMKPQLQKEVKTRVDAATYNIEGKEQLGFYFLTPNTGGNQIYVEVFYEDTAEDILARYLKEAKKQDLVLSLSFKNYRKYDFKTIFHFESKKENIHKYYGSLTALMSDNDDIGISKFTLDRWDFRKPYENEKVIIRKSILKATGLI